MNTSLLVKSENILIALVVGVIPVLILRISVDPLDLMKGSFLWILVSVLLFLRLIRFAQERRVGFDRSILIAAGLLLLASLLSTVFSIAPWTSLFGQYQRYTGFLTLISLLALLLLATEANRGLGVRWILVPLGVAALVVVGYGYLQQYGHDPLEWSSTSFNRFVFSTMGNPNTGSAWVAATLPLMIGGFLLSARKSPVGGILFGIASGFHAALIPAFVSFQGQIAALFILIVIGRYIWISRVNVLGAALLVVFGVACVVAALREFSSTVALFIPILGGVTGWAISREPQLEMSIRDRWKLLRPISRLALFCGVVISVTVGGFFLRGVIEEGFAGGFLERGDFYRAAVNAWKANPIFGTGLETYGFVFTEFRPASHAINLEGSRSSSAHSVFLGMFSNGGIVLGLAYLAFTALVSFRAISLIRNSREGEFLAIGAAASWFSLQAIFLISVEHVGLYTLNFTLAILVFLLWSSQRRSDLGPKVRTRRNRTGGRLGDRISSKGAVWALPLSAFLIVGLVFVTKPLRAGMESYEALLDYYRRSDLQSSREHLARAADIAPWEALYLVQLAETTVEAGDLDGGALIAIEAAERARYGPSVAYNLAAIVFDSGRVDEAVRISREGFRRDPYAPTVRFNHSRLMVLAAQQKLQLSLPDDARVYLEEGLSLDPSMELEGLDQLKTQLGVS
jgi:hypothetical protein